MNGYVAVERGLTGVVIIRLRVQTLSSNPDRCLFLPYIRTFFVIDPFEPVLYVFLGSADVPSYIRLF